VQPAQHDRRTRRLLHGVLALRRSPGLHRRKSGEGRQDREGEGREALAGGPLGFIRPELLTGTLFWVAQGHVLGHATLSHGPLDGTRADPRRGDRAGSGGQSSRGRDHGAVWWYDGARGARSLRAAPPCEAFTDTPHITHCPYDDWMST